MIIESKHRLAWTSPGARSTFGRSIYFIRCRYRERGDSLYASCVIGRIPAVTTASSWFPATIKLEESFASFAALVKAKRYRLPLLAEITSLPAEGGFTLTTDSESRAQA